MSHCEKCCTRFDACAECKDAEIAALNKRIKELEARLEPCEVCNSIDCEDASKDYYIKRWKEAEKRVRELEDFVQRFTLIATQQEWEKFTK